MQAGIDSSSLALQQGFLTLLSVCDQSDLHVTRKAVRDLLDKTAPEGSKPEACLLPNRLLLSCYKCWLHIAALLMLDRAHLTEDGHKCREAKSPL